MKKSIVLILLALLMSGCATTKEPIPAGEGVQVGDVISVTAEVVAVDKEKRSVTIKGPQGNMAELEVTEQVRNFDQIQVGNMLTVTYYQAVALYFGEHGSDASADIGLVAARAPEGAMPGGVIVGAVDASVTIEKINKFKRTITFMGPNGQSVTASVDKENKEAFDSLSVGDKIHVRYTEALAVTIN